MLKFPRNSSIAFLTLCVVALGACAGVKKPLCGAIPVPVPPAKVEVPLPPVYMTPQLAGNATPQEALTAMVLDASACQNYVDQLNQLLIPFSQVGPSQPAKVPGNGTR